MLSTPVKPFLIEKDEEGQVHLTARGTHYTSQGYPWIRHVRQDMAFQSVSAARAYAVESFDAKAGESRQNRGGYRDRFDGVVAALGRNMTAEPRKEDFGQRRVGHAEPRRS